MALGNHSQIWAEARENIMITLKQGLSGILMAATLFVATPSHSAPIHVAPAVTGEALNQNIHYRSYHHRHYQKPRRAYRQHRRRYDAPRRARRSNYSSAHVRYCYNRYRSYRAYDNTYQPYHGPRRQCR